jgi:RNA polymerase sigma-70 factor (ECF subfamily)
MDEQSHQDRPPGNTRPPLEPEVYARLRAIAADYLARERRGHTLQPTALVNEAFLRLGGATETRFGDRQHFVAAVARAMRNILVDHARARNAEKRGGGSPGAPLTVAPNDASAGDAVDLIELDEALARLERLDERQARVVELRFFGGLSVPETAALLGVSDRTVELDWSVARAWLRRALRGDGEDTP